MAGIMSGLVRFVQNLWQSFFEKPVEQFLQRLVAGDLNGLFSDWMSIVIPLVIIFMLVDLLMNLKFLRRHREAFVARRRARKARRSGEEEMIEEAPPRREGWLSRLIFTTEEVEEDEEPEAESDAEHEDYPGGYVTMQSASQQQLHAGRERAQRQTLSDDESMQEELPVPRRRRSGTAEAMRKARRSLAQEVALVEETGPDESASSRPTGSLTGVTAPLPINEVQQALNGEMSPMEGQNEGQKKEF